MTRPVYLFALLALTLIAVVVPLAGGPSDPEGIPMDRAEQLFAEGSYRQALEIYRRLVEDEDRTDPARTRWLAFRVADAGWRSALASNDPDDTELQQAREALDRMVRDVSRREDQDRLWAEVQESLGDLEWTSDRRRNWSAAWPRYQQALEWWAASSEIETARERYLSIVRRAIRPAAAPAHYSLGYYGNRLPLRVLEDAREIAVDREDRAWLDYVLAWTQQGSANDPGSHRRARAAFERALESGAGSEWYDDALFQFAEWLSRQGSLEPTEQGGWRFAPDFVAALERYRQLVRDFREGESRYYRQARSRIEAITEPSLTAMVSNIFLPDSEIRFQLAWRNVTEVDLAIFPIDLADELRPNRSGAQESIDGWLNRIPSIGRRAAHRETRTTGDDGRHRPGQEAWLMTSKLEPGAYLLEASGGGRTAHELILVTRASLVLKSVERRAQVWVADAISGEPRGDASVTLWVGRHQDREWIWSRLEADTDAEGLARFDIPPGPSRHQLYAVARSDDDTAFSQSWGYARDGEQAEDWRLYVFTDRPAYRPEETVEWKLIARTDRGGRLRTPAGKTLRYRIVDPRGTELAEGRVRLNAFGSASSSTGLGAELPLGEYRIEFRQGGDDRFIGNATLFRMEEYKLPEFRVEVSTPLDEEGHPRRFSPGEEVEAEIVAVTYFGAPVADAKVDVVVRQRPLYRFRFDEREFPWFYDEASSQRGRGGWMGSGQEVHRETIRTDAEGRARFRYATPYNSQQDFEYTLEARVTDAARREVVGNGTVRVTRQGYFAQVDTDHRLVQPGDRVRVTVQARSADERPVRETGELTIWRERWIEVWADPRGREVRDVAKIERGDPGWRVISQGYEREKVSTHTLTTGEDGKVDLDFEPAQVGFYRLTWTGDAGSFYPVNAETMIWVADRGTVEVGYRPGGVQILIDRDTVRAGSVTPVMISVPTPGSWVLFSIEADDLLDSRLVEVSGTVRLVELEIDDRHIPNVFLEAAMMRDGQLFVDQRELIVPPVERFLKVEVLPGAELYRPGGKGRLEIRTRDHDGRPVSAEVALALVDESIFAIQDDYAGDPRPFFYGRKRGRGVTTRSTFHEKPYVRLRQAGETIEIQRDNRWQIEAGAAVEQRRSLDEGGRHDKLDALGFAEGMVASEMVADLAAPPSAAMRQRVAKKSKEFDFDGGDDATGTVEVRTDFRSTALWLPELRTDAEGRAEVEVDFPESLTSWKATARAVGGRHDFGIGEAATQTSKPLTVRLQAPRFFVVGDRATVSAVVNNTTDRAFEVSVELTAEGLERSSAARESIRVPAGGEQRVDWSVDAEQAGKARLSVVARGGDESDAMERRYPVHEHGVEKFLARSGKVRGESLDVTLELPAARRDGSTTMTVQVTPSLAVAMLDALPYLIDYPYGCTEQTMSRFLPAAIVRRTLEELGLPHHVVTERLFGAPRIDRGDRGGKSRAERLDPLDAVIRDGMNRLIDFQHGDGGWGWWKQGDSDPFMSAYVVWGLGLARDAGVRIDNNVLQRGTAYLDRTLVEMETRPDVQAWMLHALASSATKGQRPSEFQAKAFENVWEQRDGLNAYARALMAISAWHFGDEERARVLLRNLENGVQIDDRPDRSVIVRGTGGDGAGVMGTAHWGEDGFWYRWSDGGVEATAFVLQALLTIDPDHELIEPVTNWLLKNRRGASWSNTRDTAIVLLAMTDYLKSSGELDNELGYAIEVNGHELADGRITRDQLLGAPSRFAVDPDSIRDGKNRVSIRRTDGDGPIYFAVESTFFSLEEPITPAGNEIFARRHYFRRVPRATLLRGPLYDARPLLDRGEVESGERIEVVLTVEAKNNYEYLVFEDLKPAGFEAVQLKSGEAAFIREVKSAAFERADGKREPQDYTGRSRWVHQELRDRKVALFVDRLPEGVWEIRYELRAETPGAFHALPVLGHAMYVPEIRTNGAEQRMTVTDAP